MPLRQRLGTVESQNFSVTDRVFKIHIMYRNVLMLQLLLFASLAHCYRITEHTTGEIVNSDRTPPIAAFDQPANTAAQRPKRSIQPLADATTTQPGILSQLLSEAQLRAAMADLLNELDSDDLLLHSDEQQHFNYNTVHMQPQLDALLQQQVSPLMRLIRTYSDPSSFSIVYRPHANLNAGEMYSIEVKRQLAYSPRLGRRSLANGVGGVDDCNESLQSSPFAAVRCVGKKDMQYTPRLGRRSGR